jgi:hypothetical protein
MATETAVWSVELKDSVSGAAGQAANALANLRTKIQQDSRELREMQQALSRLRQGTTVNAAAVKELTERISAKKTEIANAQGRFLELGGTFGNVAGAAGSADANMAQMMGVASRMGGPVGRLAGMVSSLGGFLSAGLAVGALAAAAAVAALTAALAAGYVALARYALGAADARRSELLHLEALTKIPNWYGIAAGKASDLQRAIDDVSGASALGRADVAKYAEELYRMGLRGKNLSTALDATAIKASTQGERWASLFMQQAAGANALGQSVDKLAGRVKSQLGGIAKQQALAFDVQIRKLKENLARIFDGVKIGPFLETLNDVLKLFSQNEAIGRALKTLVETMFSPLGAFFSGNTAMVAKRFFQGLVIGALLLTLKMLDLRDALRNALGDKKFLKDVDVLEVALISGMVVAGLFAVGLGLIAALAGTTALALAPLALLLAGVVAAAALAGTVLRAFADAWAGVRDRIGQADWLQAALVGFLALTGGVAGGLATLNVGLSQFVADMGTAGVNAAEALVAGLVKAIKAGASLVTSTVVGLGATVKSAFASALGIASPSRVFAAYGRQIGAGLTLGMGSSRHEVEAATVALAPTLPRGERSGGSRGSRGNVSIGEMHIHTKATDARGIAASIRDALAAELEGVAVELGIVPDGLEPEPA